MDMYQKRKIRAEKKNNDNDKSKVRLNWYPGHMEKTKNTRLKINRYSNRTIRCTYTNIKSKSKYCRNNKK